MSRRICQTYIFLFNLVFIVGLEDYWSDDFDDSKNCENEGRHTITVSMLYPIGSA